jgi:small subunit ribosomal protein S2
MAPFIHGRRNLIHVIDLRETLRGILRAQNLLYHMAAEGSSILWVGTKRQVKGVISDAGERAGMPVVTERWIGGTLTNFSVIRSRLKRLEELERMEDDGSTSQLSKKMISSLRRQRRKIHRNLGGIREMNGMPGAMVVVDPARELNAVREARRMGLVVIGLLDTDCDPSKVDIVIPGNDDALKSVRLLIDQLVSAVEEGSANHRERMASMGRAEKHDDMPAKDEPMPTRGNVMPKGRKSDKPAEASASAEAAPATEVGEPKAATAAEATPEPVAVKPSSDDAEKA